MKKRFVALLIGVIFVVNTLGSIKAYATDYNFDANYYARKYPDVVNVLGNNSDVLYNHYLTNGIYEGRYVSQEEETYYYENGIIKECKEREPVVTQNVTTSDTSTINKVEVVEFVPIEIVPLYSTYIDVSIDDQVVTYFEDDVVKFQAPCVTGLANGRRDTPKGTFKILTKTPGKTLKGPTWNCWVDRWMRFTEDSCGLHDASWRKSFGGEIYKTNGSHGCVNLSRKAAYELYDLVEVGTVVVVH